MEARTLTHSLASCSGLVRVPCTSTAARASAVVRPARLALRVQAVQSLSRPDASAAASSVLNAPSEEELAAPVATVSACGPAPGCD